MQDIDNGYKKIKEELEKLDKLKLIIYIDDKATYPGGIKVDFIAMLMEYGSDDFDVPFPARPFFRSTFDAHYDDISKVREMILNGTYAALAESTVKAKGSDKPLYDTGALVRSVKYKIE